ncbi:TfuA-like protein [Tropicimonas sp. TH_r6]|uniref:TfuA-like protein n=1 Tax=Tropicimonas sp. TH_r6 TaxID=3082085 RepID=UPI00295333D8|nr:TfuA-like protein [Tropicimonas sp. TH_r6]MDV7142559.1 TfuA-like protein [Tropicimonas sp. TH_r6]
MSLSPACPVVFLGPSLSRADAGQILRADFRPPAGQGDIFRACSARPPAIGLIDGIFRDAPTVRHREILWAMSRGIPVFGAASMGALRAAELAPQGMIGVGLIYRWYRRFPLLADDAVAVTHAPAALGSKPLSDALVDIRRSLSTAARRGLCSGETAMAETLRIARQPFPQRKLPEDFVASRVDQKSRDARALLQLLARHQASDAWPRVACEPPPLVHAWLDDLQDSNLRLPDGP